MNSPLLHRSGLLPYPPAPMRHAPRGPLAGLQFAVKDLFDVAGYPTGCGQPTKLALSGIAQSTAPLVTRALDGGAEFIGKSHTTELAYSLTGANPHFGTPLNVAAPDRLPGGSSSGSATAVAAGLCDFALGTDTAGSIRLPASFQGLFGLRPTHGRLSLEGCMPLAPSFDVAGFIAGNSRTFVRVAEYLLGGDTKSLSAKPRIMFLDDSPMSLSAPAFIAMNRLHNKNTASLRCRIWPKGLDELVKAAIVLQASEAWSCHRKFIERHRPILGTDVQKRFSFGKSVTAVQRRAANRVRKTFRARLHTLLRDDGVLVLPTVHDIAPPIISADKALDTFRQNALRLLYPASLSGFPQVTLPQMEFNGAPLGLSLIGPLGTDMSLIRFALKFADDGIGKEWRRR